MTEKTSQQLLDLVLSGDWASYSGVEFRNGHRPPIAGIYPGARQVYDAWGNTAHRVAVRSGAAHRHSAPGHCGR